MNDVSDSREVDEHGVSVGPWTYEETPSAEDRSIEAWSVIAADGYVIADVIYREDGPLLAVSHELLAACKAAAEWHASYPFGNAIFEQQTSAEVERQLVAAIAKAKAA